MISPRLTNCKECANIPDLLRKIDCKLAELGNRLYNNVVFMTSSSISPSDISQLLAYKRILQHRFCDTQYANNCPHISVEEIASKVIRLTAGCVPFCNEPTVCEITTCPITPCPNPTTTTTSTSSTSTTTTTSTSSTTTTTTTLNCNFSGVIDCNITTTTTTTPAPTTTTTTTYFPDPFGIPCLWSTNGGNPGLVGVYDFETNTQTDVLVPNDFNETQGINRPMAASETHLYLTSVVLNDAPEGTSENFITRFDYVLLREWSIDTTGVAPVLSYVREIKIEVGRGSFRNIWGTRVQAIAIAESPAVGPSEHPGTSYWPEVPFTMLMVGVGYQTSGLTGVYSFDLNAGGTLNPKENGLGYNSVGFGNTYSSLVSLTGLLVTNDNDVLVSARYYAQEYDLNAFNYVRPYKGLPPANRTDTGSYIPGGSGNDWASADDDNPFPVLNLQGLGVPQFSESWTDTKAMPLWGVNGLLQTLQPETNEVYTIQQTPYYEATLTTTIEDDSVWLVSAIPCANVRIVTPDDLNDCTPTALPTLVTEDEDGNKVYIGPVSFEYYGMTVEASSVVFEGMRDTVTGPTYTTDCGITIPADSVIFNGNVSMDPGSSSFPAFDYTLTFPIPINNIPLRGSIFDTGDNFFFSTNATSTTISEDGGCFYNIQNGNEVYTDVGTSSGRGSGTFTITGSEDFTVLTIKGTNRGNGGGWALGCVTPPSNCQLIYSTNVDSNCSSPINAGRCYPGQIIFKRYYAFDVDTNTQQEILLPPGSATSSPNFAVSENFMIIDHLADVTSTKSITRYGYTDVNGIPSNLTWDGQIIDYPQGQVEFYGSVMEAVTDTKYLGTWQQGSNTTNAVSKILEWDLVEGALSYNVKIDNIQDIGYFVQGDILLTYREDGTPNKIISTAFVPPLVADLTGYLIQFDYDTNAFEGVLSLPSGIQGSASISIYKGDIYIAPFNLIVSQPDLTGLWKLDGETLQWTKLDNPPAEMGFPQGSVGDFAATPQCRISDFTIVSGTTTTTTTDPNTTTTTTTAAPGISTIFTRFYPIVTNN